MDTQAIQMIITTCFKNISSTKFENLKYWNFYIISTKVESRNLIKTTDSSEIKGIITYSPIKKIPRVRFIQCKILPDFPRTNAHSSLNILQNRNRKNIA